jgi:hypothetical protein
MLGVQRAHVPSAVTSARGLENRKSLEKPENVGEVRVLTPEAVNAMRQGDAQRDNIKEIDQFG